MPDGPIPIDRYEVLDESGLLDTPPESEFDEITALAARLLNVPVALMSLVDRDRQFFKSAVGLPEPWASRRETPLTHSFCQHVAATGDPLIVEDARTVDLVKHNLAIPDLGVIAYLGMPILAADATPLGALCAIDGKPREWTNADVEILRTLAAQINTEIALRDLARRQTELINTLRESSAHRRAMSRAAAHDLRTPLQALLLGIQSIQYLGELNDQQRECVALCERNGRAVLSLTESMLDVSLIERFGVAALNRLPSDPHDIVQQAADRAKLIAEAKSISLEINMQENLPFFDVDAAKLTRVIVNLLENSVRFTESGGSIEIIVREKDGDVEIAIWDTGSGISPEHIDRIFEEGFSTGSTMSSGLGLAFCKLIVDTHGGSISATSLHGEGSIFSVRLPVSQA